MTELREKFMGCMWGLAIGDALGFPAEFMELEDIYEEFGVNGITDFEPVQGNDRTGSTVLFPRGTYSDDTQMSLATARAIINTNGADLENIMDEVVREYIAWAGSPENNRAPGDTCMEGVSKLSQGIHWKNSGNVRSKGCGAAMRTASIGLYSYDSHERLVEIARAVSICTHANPTGIAAGIGTASLTALALEGIEPTEFVTKMLKSRRHFDRDFIDKILEIDRVFGYEDSQRAIKTLGEGWVGEEAVAIALYCFLKNPRDYKKAVLMAVNTNGDSDSIACITGAISGAYNGMRAIPPEWVEKVENSNLIRKIAEELYSKSQV